MSTPYNRKALKRAFSMVELLATVAIIGIISFMAIPQVTKMRGDAEKNLAISRAESLNLAMSSFIGTRGRAQAMSDWTAANNDNLRYNLIRPYLAFSEVTLASFLPGGYDIDFPANLEPLTKVTLKNPTNARIYY